jgi:hypothetical protein
MVVIGRYLRLRISLKMLVVLADGSVRTLHPSITPGTFWAAVTPAGGEVLGNDW